MREKQVIVEGGVNMVSVKSMGIEGAEIGTAELVKIRFSGKNPITANDWPLGTNVKVIIEVIGP